MQEEQQNRRALSTEQESVIETSGKDSASVDYALVFDGLNALGALILAALALFGDRIRGWLIRPRINVDCGSKTPYVETIKESPAAANGRNLLKVRLRLTNIGRSSAKSCRVLVHDFYKKRGDGSTYSRIEIIPRDIVWPTERPQDLLRNVPYYLDICEIRTDEKMSTEEGGGGHENHKTCLYICIETAGIKGAFERIGRGTIIIPLRIYAENMRRPKCAYISVFWSGSDIGQISDSNFGCRVMPENEFNRIIGGIT